MKPTPLESCEEDIVVEKDLIAIGVIKDDKSTKEFKDVSRKPQVPARKGREKEATDIDTLTHLVKNLTMKMSELKQWKKTYFQVVIHPNRDMRSIHQPAHQATTSSLQKLCRSLCSNSNIA